MKFLTKGIVGLLLAAGVMAAVTPEAEARDRRHRHGYNRYYGHHRGYYPQYRSYRHYRRPVVYYRNYDYYPRAYYYPRSYYYPRYYSRPGINFSIGFGGRRGCW